MISFEQLGHYAGTDKVTHHGYQRFYTRFLENLRHSATGMLEIGIESHNSIHLWKNYFPNAQIYGIDIERKTPVHGQVTLLQADQSKLTELTASLYNILHPIQFIIDDGSHVPEHQILSFNFFFDHLLQPGGVYIVEDIETSYWTRNSLYGYEFKYGYRHPNSFIEKVKPIVDTINNEFMSRSNQQENTKRLSDFSPSTLSAIQSMTFGQNCVIFTKKTQAEQQMYNNRPYRFSQNI